MAALTVEAPGADKRERSPRQTLAPTDTRLALSAGCCALAAHPPPTLAGGLGPAPPAQGLPESQSSQKDRAENAK